MDKQTRKRLIFSLLASVLVALLVMTFLQPPPEEKVLVAAYALSAGHVLRESDMQLMELPAANIPADALRNPMDGVGLTLAMDRAPGDLIRTSALGESLRLQPNERAVAIGVDNASGLAGLLKPGDRVGVTAIITTSGMGGSATYAKAVVENLRVLYLSPEFEARAQTDPAQMATQQMEDPNLLMYSLSQERSKEGVVLLAVSIEQVAVHYDFSKEDTNIPAHVEYITALELLSLLDHAANASVSLYLMPDDPENIVSAGVFLPDLVVTPQPTPTPICLEADGEECLGLSESDEVLAVPLEMTPTPMEDGDE